MAERMTIEQINAAMLGHLQDFEARIRADERARVAAEYAASERRLREALEVCQEQASSSMATGEHPEAWEVLDGIANIARAALATPPSAALDEALAGARAEGAAAMLEQCIEEAGYTQYSSQQCQAGNGDYTPQGNLRRRVVENLKQLRALPAEPTPVHRWDCDDCGLPVYAVQCPSERCDNCGRRDYVDRGIAEGNAAEPTPEREEAQR